MRNQKGQVVLVLILVMTVALSIGISVIQRSLSDISTSTKVEESSRAFSAAEAGIEKAIQSGSNITTSVILDNNSIIQEVQANTVPLANQALEYPSLAKEDFAQVWLADPTSSNFPNCSADKICYSRSTLDVYWGLANITSDKPALEVTIIYKTGDTYQSKKFFLDSDSSRTSSNFTNPSFVIIGASGSTCDNPTINTSMGNTRTFYCKTTLTGLSGTLVLLRARILYSSASQPFAVKPTSDSLPVQARLFTATGTSGQTQRKVQVFRLDKVTPPYLDYAIFSTGDIEKVEDEEI